MNKRIFYISLTVAALFLVAVKSSDLMTPWIVSMSQSVQEEIGMKKPVFQTSQVQKTASTEVSEAIRRQLDADAVAEISVSETAPAQAETTEPTENSKQRIVELYTDMLPDEAARIIETMELSKIVELLEILDIETASSILSQMDLDTAHLVTQQMLHNGAQAQESAEPQTQETQEDSVNE